MIKKKTIIENVKNFSKKYTHVFVTGGIGPTHDDITAESIAEAFKRKIKINKNAKNLLIQHYNKSNLELNESRLKMAKIPLNSRLILNPVSAAPGFKIKNVWVMAGVPKIMQAMFLEDVEPKLVKGEKLLSVSVKVLKPEGDIAKFLNGLQNNFKDIEIGSYPFYKPPEIGTTLIFRGTSNKKINNAIKVLCKYLTKANIQYLL